MLMRVSSDSDRQNTDLQRDALLAAGVDARNLYDDRASGAKDDRSGLTRVLEFVRPGDVLVVWKLDLKARHSRKYFGRGKGVVAYTLLCNHVPLNGYLIGAH